MRSRVVAWLVAGIAVASLQGCMLSRSVSRAVGGLVESVSEGSKSSSERLTADAGRDEREYREDVRVATRDLVASGAQASELQRELGRVAELHGIVHWEAEPGSGIAIAAGACEAGVSPARLDALFAGLGVQDREPADEGCRTSP